MERWSDRGAAIVPYGDKIILMRRERGYGKRKKIYYTIPGGGKEEGETIRDTTVREIKEELGIDIEISELLMEFETSKRKQYVFIGKYLRGVIGTGDGEEFDGSNNYKENGGYYPELVNYNQFKKVRLVPLNLKRKILKNFNKILKVQNKEDFENNTKNKEKNITKKVLRGKRRNRHKKNKNGYYKKENSKKDFKNKSNKYKKSKIKNKY